jgi:hypothetical protein
MVERRALKSTTGNDASLPSLEQQIAAALRSDTALTAAELRALLGTVDIAIADAANALELEKAKAVDPFNPSDPATAQQRLVIAQLTADRLKAAQPHLHRQLAALQRREDGERWSASYQRLLPQVEAAAKRFAKYPALAAEMVELVNTAVAVDKRSTDLNIAAPPGESRRLPQVELLARGLKAFSIHQPSITRDLKLPDWEHSDTLVFPRREALDPSLYAAPPYDERFSAESYKRGEEQRAAAAERERQQVIADDIARRRFYGERIDPPEAPPPEATPPPVE